MIPDGVVADEAGNEDQVGLGHVDNKHRDTEDVVPLCLCASVYFLLVRQPSAYVSRATCP